MFLNDAIAYPVIAHINCAGALAANGVIHDTVGGRIVGGDWRCWLRETHLGKSGADNFTLFGVDKEGADLGFGGRRGDVFEDAGGVEDRTIVCFRFSREIAKEEVSASAAVCLGLIEVPGVTVYF